MFFFGLLLPPSPRPTGFSGDRWTFESVDMVTATRIARHFRATHTDPVDFRVTFPVPGPDPQGCMTFSYEGDTRLLLHFVEPHDGHAAVTSIAMANDEMEAQKEFLLKVRTSPSISLHPTLIRQQPRWGMLARYYLDW